MGNTNFAIVKEESRIHWIGRKVTGAHDGTIDIREGSFVVNDGLVESGKFIIDVASIKILDVEDQATNMQFAGHLASDDFFSTDKYPTALFEVKSATRKAAGVNSITGDLTIKGITHPVSFDAAINTDGDTLKAAGKIVIDRTKYDIKFRSGNFFQNLGDTLIYNDFDLEVNITAKAAK